MFWGLILKHGKKYSQTVSKAFHLSAASLDTSSAKGGDIQVLLTSDSNVYILCTLNKDNDKQRSLDLNFAEGDKICFSIKGEGIVHLTGFLIPDAEDFMDMSDEEEESPVKNKNGVKKEKQADKNLLAKLVQGGDSDDDEMDDTFDPSKAEEDDDEEDSDDDEEAGGEEAEDGSDDDDEDDDDDDDEDEEDDSDDEQPAKKVQKGQDGQKVKQNGLENGKAVSKEQKKEKPQQQGGAKTLTGGVQIQELSVGNGPEAKPGKKVAVYYEGRLKSNNKIFDSTKKGNGFKFKLGGGEVIKGWDVGVAGMKVGGKRRITCPPHMAYGQKGSPPVIPSNATLVFDVELKNVH